MLSPWGAAAFVTIFALDGVQVHVGHVKALTVTSRSARACWRCRWR
jgi:hypothetical protein